MEQQFNQDNFNSYEPQFQYQKRIPLNLFETASWVLAIAAVLSCTCFYGSYILGALAIVFALLSRGGQMKMSPRAKLGLILAIFAIILTTVVTISSVYIALEEYGSFENILREYCNMYGLDFEELYGEMF